MKPSEDTKLLEVVRATGEIYGKQVSVTAALMFLADLDAYSSDDVMGALSRCRKELRTFPTVADVIARIDDGRPGVEEAWAMIPKTEEDSVIWNEEIAEAYGICRKVIESDPIAARMTFKELYSRIVAEGRASGRRLVWSPSFGFEKEGRNAAIAEAVAKGRLTQNEAQALLPDFIPSRETSSIKLTFLKEMPK